MFTSWDVLFDNNLDTFFHSNYDNRNSEDGLDHYIRIELPEAPTGEEDFIFSYTTRKGTSNWFPAEAVLEYSVDGEEWDTITTLADELPFKPGTVFMSAPFSIPAGTRYVRFMVNKNRESATNGNTKMAGGHCFFVLTELSMANYVINCSIDTRFFPTADLDVYKAAIRQLHISDLTLERPRYSNPDYDEAYAALLPHYEALKSIYDNGLETGITEISVEDASALHGAMIYTINGVRLNKISEKGIYIIDGRKVIVK